MFVKTAENYIDVTDFGEINLDVTLDCGQAFRWRQNDDLSWTGVVKGVETTVYKINGGLRFRNITENQFRDIFYNYFDMQLPYDEIIKTLSDDKHLKKAIEHYGTIRILNQDPWETLCSFIISACNNIPRIKSIIEKLCETYGDRTENSYTFPSAEKIASLTEKDLAVIRAGYRVPYILDAAKKVSSGEVNLLTLPFKTVEECEKELMKINGVGKKVADCTILFSTGHIEAFPIDRHIKRICENLYPDGLPECTKGVEGIAQQYMFHLQRMAVVQPV